MLFFKDGVSLKGLMPQMIIALQVAEEEFTKMATDTWVTSGNDSTHMDGSYHYKGRALDFRTKNAPGIASTIVAAITARLKPIGFQCIWEDRGGDNEHLHIELDEKAAGY